MNTTEADRYNRTLMAMHWLMLLLLAAVYLCIELRELYPKGSDPRNALKAWHFMLGLCVWLLVIIRLVIRWRSVIPPVKPSPPVWQSMVSKLVHMMLYLFMLGMPIVGLLVVNYEGHAVSFFGLELPVLVAENSHMAETLEDWHETAGEAAYWLIGLHAAAALMHHYVFKDNTLKRMMPW
ncbi:cytochrome b [Marinicella sediminis]|uniref:Cytochrome b n=1 Tax=Marinicella sediminis TaxID=1792834 RepID=A0ABV7J7Y5_9GAMM|nr:cytochrome b [Marinicella sediminis]